MWKKYIRTAVMLGLFFLVFGLGTFLPEKLFAIADEKKLGKMESSQEPALIIPDARKTDIVKKMQLLYQKNPASLQIFELYSNTNEQEKMEKLVRRELKNLQKYKLLPKKPAPASWQGEKYFHLKYLVVDTALEGEFLTVWYVYMHTLHGGTLHLWIETESEKVLAINFIGMQKHDWKNAGKCFKKYLRKELAIEAKDIPIFSFYYAPAFYGISMDFLQIYQNNWDPYYGKPNNETPVIDSSRSSTTSAY